MPVAWVRRNTGKTIVQQMCPGDAEWLYQVEQVVFFSPHVETELNNHSTQSDSVTNVVWHGLTSLDIKRYFKILT